MATTILSQPVSNGDYVLVTQGNSPVDVTVIDGQVFDREGTARGTTAWAAVDGLPASAFIPA